MRSKKIPLELGKRERQIVETVIKLGEASVADVRKNLADPPSYSSVRAMLGLLVDKKWLKFRRDGKKYLYLPANGAEKYRQTAIGRIVDIFFKGSLSETFAALLDTSVTNLTDAELISMIEKIKQVQKDRK